MSIVEPASAYATRLPRTRAMTTGMIHACFHVSGCTPDHAQIDLSNKSISCQSFRNPPPHRRSNKTWDGRASWPRHPDRDGPSRTQRPRTVANETTPPEPTWAPRQRPMATAGAVTLSRGSARRPPPPRWTAGPKPGGLLSAHCVSTLQDMPAILDPHAAH